MVGESFHHMVAGVRTVTIFRKGATAQKLLRLFAFGCETTSSIGFVRSEVELLANY
jgi:hypothetical protein